MVADTNKQRGNCGLGIAIAYFSTNGYTVSIPLNDTQDYDLLIDKDGKIENVQVKYTSCKTKYGVYQLALKSCGGTKGKTYKTVLDTNVDYLFAVTENVDMYMIPVKELKNRSTINLCEKLACYKVK